FNTPTNCLLPGTSKQCNGSFSNLSASRGERSSLVPLRPCVPGVSCLGLGLYFRIASRPFLMGCPLVCTFPENTEPAATGQGVVSVDFSAPTGERPSRARRGSPR